MKKISLKREAETLIIEELSKDYCAVSVSGGDWDGSEFEIETDFTESVAWYLNQGYEIVR